MLFQKNDSKIADIIQYEGDNSTFIWKHPCENFNSLTQLIVHESQEAIFFMNGQALDLFGPGRHTLTTQNIPKVGKFLNRSTDNETPFHCEVYFVNQTVQMGLKWGTDSQIRYIDPDSGIPLQIGASGEMNIKVSDSRKLLIKLVGTMHGIAWDKNGEGFTKSLQSSFRPMISNAVKSNLTTCIKRENINILEVDEHLDELSLSLQEKIIHGFEEYGMTIPQFYITTILLPENDSNFKRIRELYTVSLQKRLIEAGADVRTAQAQADADVAVAQRMTIMEQENTKTEVAKREAERRIIEAKAEAEMLKAGGFAEAEVMHAKGYNQKDVLSAEVQKAYAEGIGHMGGSGGSTMGDIVGLGIGLQAAGVMGGQIGNIFTGINTNQQTVQQDEDKKFLCPKCGQEIPAGSKFCLECGEKVIVIPDGKILCPDCGQIVANGKFCIECGHKFITVCPNCNKEIPNGAKFCLECGNKL